MTSKMAARVLTYKLRRIAEFLQFKAQKVKKLNEEDCLAIYGERVIWMRQRMVLRIFSRN